MESKPITKLCHTATIPDLKANGSPLFKCRKCKLIFFSPRLKARIIRGKVGKKYCPQFMDEWLVGICFRRENVLKPVESIY